TADGAGGRRRKAHAAGRPGAMARGSPAAVARDALALARTRRGRRARVAERSGPAVRPVPLLATGARTAVSAGPAAAGTAGTSGLTGGGYPSGQRCGRLA